MANPSLEESILLACKEDHVGLWEVVRIVKRALPGADPIKPTLSVL